jgi:two-component system, OmpR family, sensor histidine kinase VicK
MSAPSHPSAMELENRVRERTASLRLVNRELRKEIRAHQKTSHALRESEQWLRTITDSIPVLIAYLDHRLKCRFTNQRAIEWFGAANRTGANDPSIARRQAFVNSLSARARDALGGNTVNQEVEFHDCNGALRIASVDLVPHFANARR